MILCFAATAVFSMGLLKRKTIIVHEPVQDIKKVEDDPERPWANMVQIQTADGRTITMPVENLPKDANGNYVYPKVTSEDSDAIKRAKDVAGFIPGYGKLIIVGLGAISTLFGVSTMNQMAAKQKAIDDAMQQKRKTESVVKLLKKTAIGVELKTKGGEIKKEIKTQMSLKEQAEFDELTIDDRNAAKLSRAAA